MLLRTGLVLGADGGALKALRLPFLLGLGGALGSGRQWWPWVHIADAVGAIMHVLTSTVDGPVNVAAPNPVQQRDLAKVLARVLKRPAILPAPAFALRLALGEVATDLLQSRRAQPRRLQESGYWFNFTDIDAALRALLRR